VEAIALAGAPQRAPSRALDALAWWARVTDRASWIKVALWVRVASSLRAFALRVFPDRVLDRIRGLVAGSAAETAAFQKVDKGGR